MVSLRDDFNNHRRGYLNFTLHSSLFTLQTPHSKQLGHQGGKGGGVLDLRAGEHLRQPRQDDGQLLGHNYMGCEMIAENAKAIEGFPPKLLSELQHCILAHHGELEFGSPKTPELMEAMALHMADNTDAKLETFKEATDGKEMNKWLGINRPLGGNIRRTSVWTEVDGAETP